MVFIEIGRLPRPPWPDALRNEIGYQLSGRVLEKVMQGEDSVTLHVMLEFKEPD